MIVFKNSQNDINTVVQELRRIYDQYDIPESYKSYIHFIAWKLEKDFVNGYGEFNTDSENLGRKTEEKEEKA